MRKQIRGAMLALAALVGIAGQAQGTRDNSAIVAPGVPASRVAEAAKRAVVHGRGGHGPVWMGRVKRGNRAGRSRWDYGR